MQGKGQRSHKAKNRRKHFRGEIGRAISNLVAVLVSDLWAMAGKNGTVFYERGCVGWHCAKVKGQAELKIEKI